MHKKIISLKNKNILLCISGSIAAYKSCDIIRTLTKEGANVQVMMSDAAQKFIGLATISALTNHEVLTSMFPDKPKSGLKHINFSFDLDAIIIAPATANILAKAASGVADDIISTTLSVCEQPVLFVPAMNDKMWQNKAIIDAVSTLRERNKRIMDPVYGDLASLHKGEGRFPELHDIINELRSIFDIVMPLKNKHIIITAGPTQESMDPIRYLSNRSSGKMGYSFAEVARDMGAKTTLISGPVKLATIPEIKTIYVDTTINMLEAIEKIINSNEPIDYIIMSAAPSDYIFDSIKKNKIKKTNKNINLKLKPAPDILKKIRDKTDAIIVSFALETNNGEYEAKRKMKDKKSDYIVLNYANETGAGFESDTNRVIVFSKNGERLEINKDRKDRIAKKIMEFII